MTYIHSSVHNTYPGKDIDMCEGPAEHLEQTYKPRCFGMDWKSMDLYLK